MFQVKGIIEVGSLKEAESVSKAALLLHQMDTEEELLNKLRTQIEEFRTQQRVLAEEARNEKLTLALQRETLEKNLAKLRAEVQPLRDEARAIEQEIKGHSQRIGRLNAERIAIEKRRTLAEEQHEQFKQTNPSK